MTTETRIGIVTGLIIVVAASVYFFYGNGKDDEGVLVSSPTRVTIPPKIPAAADLRPAGADKKAAPQRVARGPVRQGPGPLANNFAQRRPPEHTVTPPSQGALSRDGRRPPGQKPITQQPDTPVALRTGPSTELVEATWDNLLKREKTAGDGATKPSSTTEIRPQPLPRGSPSVVSNPPGVVTAAPAKPILTTSPPSAARPVESSAPADLRPVATWPKKHTIAAGDLLSKISKEYYGDGSHGSDILAANPQIKDERHLQIGDVLTLLEPKTSGIRPSPGQIVEKPNALPTDAAPSVTASHGGGTYTV